MNVPSLENVRLLSYDEDGGSSDERSDSSEDEVTEHLTARSSPPVPDMATARAQVPTISVTPHSPGVLEDSLQQLRRLHVAVQRMRAAPPPLLQTGTNRLSASCPSLSKDGIVEPDCSSPTHTDIYSQSRKGSGESRQWGLWEGRDEGRRSSWAALEPGDRGRRGERSASLSSMESEGEVPRPVRHSTHSLNDSDLAKDFEKLTMSLRARPSPDLPQPLAILGARLPLQKSVSTPSIVGPPAPPRMSAGGASDTESEDEASRSGASRAEIMAHLPHHHLAFLEQTEFEHHSEKRRKRGSLFFRKKKDKSRKASHSWTPCSTARGVCDWCACPLTPLTAITCTNCTSTVHQNVCKEYVVDCNKPKPSKSVGKSLSTSSGKAGKRSSVSSQSQSTNSTSHFCNEDKDSDHKHDQSSTMDEASTWECPEAFLTADQLGHEAIELGLAMPETDTWAGCAPKGLSKQLGERETKRQEHIYELILTEKHHCLTIRLMQKLFVDGMRRHGATSAHTSRMFPCLGALWALHSALLSRLRSRQREAPVVTTVADILVGAFADVRSDTRAGLRAAYGEFCSRHRDAVDFFKESCAREPKLARFIRKCQQNTLLRKKGVPECVLFVAQRLTKYPLLIEPLLKAADDAVEKDTLARALAGVKEILVDVDNQVAAKEREDRKLEIYHRIDAKSFAIYRGRKFKKSDILQGSRSLKFEGVATLMQGRNKMQNILVVVLSDVLLFLHDNNNKYTFFTPENKAGVVSLSKLLVREKAGADAKGLYLICSGSAHPEMYELRLLKPKDIPGWISAIRAAVQQCPEEAEECEAGATAEDTQRQLEARHESIAILTDALRAKDREHAVILEEKMALHMKMVGHTGTNYTVELPITDSWAAPGLLFPQYVRLSVPAGDTHALWQDVCRMVNEAIETNNSAWSSISLNRSTSSAGERHSCAYQSPALPRRADTFAGFDRSRLRASPGGSRDPPEVVLPSNNNYNSEAALKLTHSVYTLACVVWQQLTTIHSLEAQLAAWRNCGPGQSRSHDTQLEELRDAQARLTAERATWETARNRDMDAVMQERRQLAAARQELAEQQKDVEQQRERLYRRLEMLQKHGGSQEEIASVGTLSPDTSVADNTKRKEPKWRSSRSSLGSDAPPQLLSASNESRATAHPVVKQQLPLKLASGKNQQAPPAPPGYHRLHESPSDPPIPHHTRAGSSPAPVSAPQPTNNKATRTNTYPKLPDKFRPRSSTERTKPEEEVIYF